MSLNPSSHEVYLIQHYVQGRIQGGHTRHAPPPKIGKNKIFWRKIVIFHTKYPQISAPPSARRNFFKFIPLPT
jgi:hypothetical protein